MGALNCTASRPGAFAGLVMAKTALQLAAIMMLSLVAGATFGIWRGLGSASPSAATFIEMHQELVRGLNVLLPTMGAGSAILALALAWFARRNRQALQFYLVAFALAVAAAFVTRLWNQPINAQVMGWTVETVPADWTEVRGTWWHWHVVRTLLSIGATANLILAVMADRSEPT